MKNNSLSISNLKKNSLWYSRLRQRHLPIKTSDIKKNYELYLFLVPAIILTICFAYIPMYGVVIAFKNFSPAQGIWGSDWAGLRHFIRFFRSSQSIKIISNTLLLSIYSILLTFPIPIMLALMLNQMGKGKFRKTLQTVTYLPHFISVVVVVSMINLFLSPSSGLYGIIMNFFGAEAHNLMGDASMFRSIYVLSDVWQHTGWDSIIYLAALSAIDPALYDAATVDGAGRWKKILYVDIPGIAPTFIIMLILRMGGLMNIAFDKAFLMQNNLNLGASQIISTYVYKIGLESNQYSMAAAVGLFNNIINFTLLIVVNKLAKRINETSLW